MTHKLTEQINPKKNIIIKGAKLNNLKNIDVVIPRNKFVVITGLSGSGKSTLAFDTLYAEGQRRYVESLSSYARQFLGKLNKPKVDYIKGIAPAVAIEQKVNTTNARSTVGTSTEIYDYLKLLFSRIGKTFSPISGREVKKHQIKDVVDFLLKQELQSRWLLLSPLHLEENRTLAQKLNILLQQGFQRIYANEKMLNITDVLGFEDAIETLQKNNLYLVIDRLIIQTDEDFVNRLSDAVQISFYEGRGDCVVTPLEYFKPVIFSHHFSIDGITFNEPSIHLFSFNNPFGACETCNGYGNMIGIDDDLVIPNTALSIYEGAIAPWKGESMSWYKDQLIMQASKFNFPIHKPYFELSADEKKVIWTGNDYFTGLNAFFAELEEKNYKIQNRVMLSRYRGKTVCKTCEGKRLKKEANYVKIDNYAISDLVDLPIVKLIPIFKNIKLTTYEQEVSKRLMLEINNRLDYLNKVGLGYLTLNRTSSTLSGGESQRINLATSLGSSLVGSMYILDEPSIGLHSKDTEKLIEVLEKLRDLGNTVIVVEHDEDIMKKADYIIDFGPEAGNFGGEVVGEGTFEQIIKLETLTAKYLNHSLKIDVPKKRRTLKNFIEITGAKENNLKNIDVKFPLDGLTVITGVSGSGKSTLVKKNIISSDAKKIDWCE